ncbi:hypothetical protein [Alienimonas californiensis]|uniref:Uncharacterized protein n=1 Tax=Alienimonas californiensis TaxID=2527989 RepID=A0A517P8V8_9PLAN|nr:hypothetical protein [Alienimonas californiensis]QDT15801.1 hypothetical protein CA12_18950 [Alienimonas californiensis]
MSNDAVIVLMAVAVVGLGMAWTLLLCGCVRRRGEPIDGRRWLTAAGLCGAIGPACGVALMFLAGSSNHTMERVGLEQALVLLLAVSQLFALLFALWGLRSVWRQTEGWGER